MAEPFVDDRQLTRANMPTTSPHPNKVKKVLDADQSRITDLYSDSRLTDAAEKIIDSGSCAVSKPVRAGFTTSAIYACDRKGLKLLVLEPTTRLLKETIGKASNGDYIRVTGNNECPIQEKEARQNKILKKLPFILPDCTKCKMYKTCPVLEIHRVKDFNVVGLTYAKLESMMLSNGKMAKDIIQKISSVDVVLLDEAHLLSLPTPPSVAVFTSVNIPDDYKMLTKILSKWSELCQNHITEIQELMEKSKQGFASQYLSIHASNQESLSWKDLKVAWAQLRKLAINKELPNNEILVLRDIITILASTSISLNFISDAGTEGSSDGHGTSGTINVTASHTRQGFALNDFLRNKVPFSTHLYGSGTMFESYPYVIG